MLLTEVLAYFKKKYLMEKRKELNLFSHLI